MPTTQVRPNVSRLTDADARHLLAEGLLRACHKHGPSRVALEIGCDEKTVRRARDEESTLNLACAVNLLDVDEHALDALIGAKGFRVIRMALAESVDAIVANSATIYRLSSARSHHSPGGAKETDDELIAMEAEVDAALAANEALKARIVAAKLRRAA